jgi:DNA-binding transcriptional LysR family regulator
MSRLDLTALRYFSEAAACGSIRQASDRLHVTPSAVSRQIAKLEARLHTTLMERRPEGVRLTQAGRMLADEVSQIHRMVDRLQARIGDLEGLKYGSVSIRCLEGAVDTWLPNVIDAFHVQHPRIQYEVAASNSDETVECLAAGTCDIGVAFRGSKRSDIGVVASRSVPLVAMVGPAHPLAGKTSISLATLLQQPLALPGSAFGVRRVLDQLFKQQQCAPDEVVTTNSIAIARALARRGTLATVLPRFSAQHDIANGHIKAIPITGGAHLKADVELCVRKGDTLPVAAKELLKLMKERFSELTHG